MAIFTHKICTANRMRQLDVSNGSERMQHFLLVRSSFIPANNKRWQRLQSSRCRILPMHRETHESGWLVWALLLLTKLPHSEGSAIWRLWCGAVCSAFKKAQDTIHTFVLIALMMIKLHILWGTAVSYGSISWCCW